MKYIICLFFNWIKLKILHNYAKASTLYFIKRLTQWQLMFSEFLNKWNKKGLKVGENILPFLACFVPNLLCFLGKLIEETLLRHTNSTKIEIRIVITFAAVLSFIFIRHIVSLLLFYSQTINKERALEKWAKDPHIVLAFSFRILLECSFSELILSLYFLVYSF